MVGPITAMMRSGLAPSLRMASTVASTMPASAPRQPAWAAPMTRASPSQNSTGAQSAVSTPMARPGVLVTMASASGSLSPFHGALGDHRIGAVLLETVMRLPGSAPSSSATRARFSGTLAASSREPGPQLSEA